MRRLARRRGRRQPWADAARHRLSAGAVALSVAALVGAPGAVGAEDRYLALTSPVASGEFEARFVEDRDHIAIIELSGNYDRDLPSGEFNFEPRALVAQEFFLHHPDIYDFLVVFTTFEFESGDAVAFHAGVQNRVEGIGLPLFDNSESFGSAGKLQGYIDMAALTRWQGDPLQPDFEFTLATLAHEVLHQWAAYVRFLDPNGQPSEALLGKDDSHWSFLLDTDASVIYGNDWRDNQNGTFTSGPERIFFSPLDLYLAGFLAPEEVPPFVLLESPGVDKNRLPERSFTVEATSRVVTLDDIIAVEGPRVPPAGEAQRDFRSAFVFVVRPGQEPSDRQIRALNHIREGLLTRFTVLTGGRGLMEVFPQARLDVEPGGPTPVTGGDIRPGEVVLAEGLAFLRQQQRSAGFWEDTTGTRLRDTSVVLGALTRLDPLFTGEGLALGWLEGRQESETDALTRLIEAFELHNRSAAGQRSKLAALQRNDGGWGLDGGFRSDPLDTALAMLALAGRPELTAAGLDAATVYLLSQQGENGGWANTPGGASRTGVTTTALQALTASGALTSDAPQLERAISFLAARQNLDGGFGDSPSTAHDTANVLQVLLQLEALDRVRGEEAATYLRSRQTVDGSWEGSVHTTALVVDVLKRLAFPNWTFAAPLVALPASPRDGERAEIRATLRNDGNAIAPAGLLRIFDGDPDAGGVPIAADVALPPLAPLQSTVVTVLWDTFDQVGSHRLFAVVDPDGAVPELSELDNRAILDVDVQASPPEADLEIRSADLTVMPAQPATLPSPLAVSVTVRNLGQTTAENVRVVLREGSGPIDEATILVPQRSSTVVNFSFLLTRPGTTVFTVEVDPDRVIVEADEENNVASVSVTTVASLDLAVGAEDVTLDGGVAPVGSDVIFRVVLRNRGTIDAPSVDVRFRVTDGITERDLGTNTIQPAAGESVLQNVQWRVDLTGDLSFLVEIDPDNLIPEADETNNGAALSFTATAVTDPNLVVDFRDLTFEPDPGREGQALTLSAVVRNSGDADAIDVDVAFFDGDPEQGGTLLGEVQVLPLVAADSTAIASLTLPLLVGDADRLIFVVVDPDNRIVEFEEGDNRAFETLIVLSLPDLTLDGGSLILEPRFPRPDQPVTLDVEVANLGEQEATSVAVRVFDGDPALGGQPLGGDQLLDLVPAGGLATARFGFLFPAGEASTLVVEVDPDNLQPEGSELNNRARLDVAVQDSDFFVSERFFSPNGDNVKDTTQLFFRLQQTLDVRLEILDARDEVVRAASFSGVGAGQFEWDGRDDRGRLARDGDYRLRVVDTLGGFLGQATATLDTNRSSLLAAVGTPFASFSNLTCELPRVDLLELNANEDALYAFVADTGDPLFPKGIYRMGPSGGDPRLVIGESFLGGRRVTRLSIAPDGSRLAFSTTGRLTPSSPREFPKFWIVNPDGTGLEQIGDRGTLVGFADSLTVILDTLVAPDTVGFLAVPLDGTAPRTLFITSGSISSSVAEFSPDRTKLVFRENRPFPEESRVMLLDIPAAAATELRLSPSESRASWSPDGTRLAVAGRTGEGTGTLEIFDADGSRLRSVPLPVDRPPFDEPDFVFPETLRLEETQDPQWSTSGTELALMIRYDGFDFELGFFFSIGRAVVFDLVTGRFETVAWTESFSGFPDSYHVSTWDGASWKTRGELHYGLRYQEQRLDLSPYLPDPDGEVKVRIRQRGAEAAHVDSVSLFVEDLRLLPTAASFVGGGDVLETVRFQDNEVLDHFGREVELRWDELAPGMELQLALDAREEVLSNRNAIPFRYPPEVADTYLYRVDGAGGLQVDGAQTAADGLAEPLFHEASRPGTGHPWGVVSGYVKSDTENLYAALDFTVDNTLDADQDWAALEILTADGWQQFRVTATEQTYGRAGFTRTGLAPYNHKLYEFSVPLAAIGTRVGETLELRFFAYGTAAILDEQAFAERLPLDGKLLFVPNEPILLYGSTPAGEPSIAILLEEGNRFRDLFTNFFRMNEERFVAAGRRLFFSSSDDRNDPTSPCFERGFTDDFSFQSLMNLTADLRARRSATAGGVLLDGTAADLNFSTYELEFASAAAPDLFRPIVPAVAETVVDGRFTTWVPPAPGTYFARLTARDLAGNERRVVRRISWSDTLAITDLFREPSVISPNGDGVQDEVTFHYRVLQPVHLEFQFFNERGDRVRTIERDHSLIGATFELVWDGRDQNGLPLPDGDYRIVVQNFEFFQKLDSTPPAVVVSLRNALQPLPDTGGALVSIDPQVSVRVEEENFQSLVLQTGEGATPFLWEDTPIELRVDEGDPAALVGERELNIGEFTNRRFRVRATDRAGNQSLVATPLGDQEVIVEAFGPHLAANGGFQSLRAVRFLGQPPLQFELSPVRFAVTETVRSDLFQVFVQHRPLGASSWFEAAIQEVLPPGQITPRTTIPDPSFEVVWDLEGVSVGVVTETRLRVLDLAGGEHFSNALTFKTDGLQFNGVLGLEDLQGPSGEVVAALLEAGGGQAKFGPNNLLLWGIEFVAEPIAELQLFLQSDVDPRFAVSTPLDAIAVVDGGFLFSLEEPIPCGSYTGFALATTVAQEGVPTRSLATNRLTLALPCLKVEAVIDSPEFGECNSSPTGGLRTVQLTPESLNGVELVLLTLARTAADGSDDVLFNVNRPVSGRTYTFELDTSQLTEGVEVLTAALSNGEGEVAEQPVEVVVDRQPPELAVNFPLADSRLCGAPRETEFGPRNVLDFEGRIEDEGGFFYFVELETPLAPGFRRVMEDGPQARCYGDGTDLFDDFPGPQCNRQVGPLATYGDDRFEVNFSGDATVRLNVFDRGGFHSCQQVAFFFDGSVEGVQASVQPELFSPNGDSLVDEAQVSVAVAEVSFLDLDVHRAVLGSEGPAITGPVLRSVTSGLQVLDAEAVAWDGRDDSGTLLEDGLYGLVATLRDGCGNLSRRQLFVELDNTPPEATVQFPRTGDPLPMVIEVLGSVNDPNLKAFAVEFGVGSAPQTFARISTGSRNVAGEVLANWNTFGLSGAFTLRLLAVDLAENAREVLVPLDLGAPVNLLSYFEAVPRLFSPNGDGRRERAALRFGLDVPAEVDLTLLGPGGAVRTLLASSPRGAGGSAVEWDGLGDASDPVPDGPYTALLTVRLAENPAVTQEERLTLVVDRTPPLLEITRPSGGFVTGSGGVQGTVQDPHLLELVVSLAEEPQAPLFEELLRGTTNRIDQPLGSLAGLAEGDYLLRVEARDQAENRSELRVPFVVDNTEPRIELETPVAGTLLGAIGAPFDVTGAIQEENLSQYRLEIGAGVDPDTFTVLEVIDRLPSGPTLAALDVSGLADGPYTVRLVAEDLAGLTAEERRPIVVDSTPPVARLEDPVDGAFLTSLSPVTGVATDDNFARFELAMAPGPRGASGQFTPLADGLQPIAGGVLATLSALPPDGTHTLRLVVRDGAGNEAEDLVEVIVDTTPPAAPQGLVAKLEEGQNARLSWVANGEPDLAGYRVLRDGSSLTPEPIPGIELLDPSLSEGRHTYTVLAVDRAGLESEPSAAAEVLVDITPPTTRLQSPTAGARVSGLVDIVGSASSADDFREYRLFATPAAGGARQLLRRSPVPVQADVLGQLNTVVLAEGAAFVLRLEAEDLSGNVGIAEVEVTVDNQPPAPPSGLAAVVGGSPANDVELTWSANTETDLLGYLLFRDGRLANTSGVVVGELTPFVLKPTQFSDLGRPDGTFVYEVHAIDRAGNLSDPSAAVEATVDTREPQAVITSPEDGTEFEETLFVLATTEDTDVAQVQFELRAVGSGPWIDLGPADSELPWTVDLDPVALSLSFGDFELRAVATDEGGKTDPAPAAITVTFTDLTRPSAVETLSSTVDGGDVALAWSDVADPDLLGYHVERTGEAGSTVRVTTTPVAEPRFTDSGVADGLYRYVVLAVDEVGNEADPSPQTEALVFTPLLEQPLTPIPELVTELRGSSLPLASVQGEASGPLGTVALPPLTTDDEGGFVYTGLAIERGETTFTVRVTGDAGNRSKAASVRVRSAAGPGPPTGLAGVVSGGTRVDLSWNANPEPDLLGYRPFRDGETLLAEAGFGGLSASASSESGFSGRAVRAVDGNPSTYWAPITSANQPVAGQFLRVDFAPQIVTRVEIDWRSFGPEFVFNAVDYDLEAWDGSVWVKVAKVRGNLLEQNSVPLLRPYRTGRLRVLLLTSRLPDVNFQPIRLAELRLFRQPLVTGTTFVDNVPDGEYDYSVTAVNAFAFESEPATIRLAVGDVTPPEGVVLSAVVSGSDVSLTWTPSPSPDVARYDLLRDGEKFAEQNDLADLSFIDAGRPNGIYRYTVIAIDAVGNRSAPSNEVGVEVAVEPPSAPVSLSVAVVPSGSALDLAWLPGAGQAPVGYRVLRALESGGPFAPVGVTALTTLRDGDLDNGTTYFYVVVALDAVGNESGPSNEASGTPADLVAPAPPVLHAPGFPGLRFETLAKRVLVAGTTEASGLVTLFRQGSRVGQVEAQGEREIERTFFSADTRLSPDGRLLIASGCCEQRVFDYATGIETVLPGEGRGRWFPDSRRILLAGESFTAASADVLDVVSGTVETLFQVPDFRGAVPSPDGELVAVFATRDEGQGLFLFEVSTGSWRQITDDPFFFNVDGENLNWSLDGERVAYLRFSPAQEIEVVTLATGEAFTLETLPSFDPPQFSPDGSWVVFVTTEAGFEQVVLHRLSDGDRQLPIPGSDPSRAPHFSPDGRRLAFYRPATRDVAVLDLSTQEVESLVDFDPSGNVLLTWVRGGALAALSFRDQVRVLPEGVFQFQNVALEDGDNVFTALATDTSGNRGDESLPMVVTVPVDGRPDLVIAEGDLAVVPAVGVVGGQVRVSVTVRNTGPLPSPPADLTLVALGAGGSQVLLDGVQVGALQPGGGQTLSADLLLAGPAGSLNLVAKVDPFDRIEEVSELNNEASRQLVVASDEGPVLAVDTDRVDYGPRQEVQVLVEVTNGGEPFSGRVAVRIEDGEGFVVTELATLGPVALDFGEVFTGTTLWNTDFTFAGSYRARAILEDAAGVAVRTGEAPFTIAPESDLAVQVTSDQAAYPLGVEALLTGEVRYTAGNVPVEGAVARFLVANDAGTTVADLAQPLGGLLPGSQVTVSSELTTADLPLGSYSVLFRIELEGDALAQASTLFQVVAGAPQVKGSLSLSDPTPAVGDTLEVLLVVENLGSEPLAQVPLRLRLDDPVAGNTLEERLFTFDLGPRQPLSAGTSFATGGLRLQSYLLILEADLPAPAGTSRVTLAVATVAPVDLELPALAVLVPTDGGFLGADLRVIAQATDALSGIDRVSVSVDGGGAVALAEADAAAAEFAVVLVDLAEGPHSLIAAAVDGAGNRTEVGPLAFVADITPPVITVDGVEDGAVSSDPVRPVITVDDSNPGTVIALLNGEPFLSGTEIDEEGDYVLVVDAEDAAGNRSQLTLGFTLQLGQPELVLTKAAELLVDADGNDTPSPGDRLRYTLTVSNVGDAAASGVVLTDPLAEHTTLVPGSVVSSRGSVEAESPLTVSVGGLEPRGVDPPPPPGIGEAVVTFDADIDLTFPATALEVVNQATVTSAELPPVLSDDPATPAANDPTAAAVTIFPAISVDDTAAIESDAAVSFSVSLDRAGNRPVSVGFSTADGTALAGEDYVPDSGSLLFEPGTLEQSVSVVLLDDAVDEPAETLLLLLSSPETGVLEDGEGLATLLDDDPPAISIDDATVDEGNEGTGEALFTVRLTSAPESAVTVAFSTAEETATAGEDYEETSGTLTFAAGETEQTLSVTILGDLLLEPLEETFVVSLSSPEGATLADSEAIGTIVDDELCLGPNLIVNPGAEAPLEAGELAGWSEVEGTEWQARQSDPLAQEGDRYFFAGEVASAELSQDVDVAVYAAPIDTGEQLFAFRGFVRTADETPEDGARVVVEYRDDSNAVVLDSFDSGELSSRFAWLEVFDLREAPAGTRFVRVRLLATRWSEGGNDGYFDGLELRSVRRSLLGVGDVTLFEGNSGTAEAPFTVALNCPLPFATSVDFTTADGSAVAGEDYEAVAGSVTVPAGETESSVAVPVIGDTEDEPHETFFLRLSGLLPAEEVLLFDGEGAGTIRNDDFCPRSPGFWKRRLELWPVDALIIGGFALDMEQLLELLRSCGDASTALARQLIATKLNLEVGSDPSILPIVEQADAFLEEHPPGSGVSGPDEDEARSLKKQLRAYNSADCDDDDDDDGDGGVDDDDDDGGADDDEDGGDDEDDDDECDDDDEGDDEEDD